MQDCKERGMRMHKIANIEFDIAYDYPLDLLRQEILDLVKNEKTKVFFDVRGPAGGNTCVLVFTEDRNDLDVITSFAISVQYRMDEPIVQ